MAVEVPSPESFKVESSLEVRWGDLDALGHVNNSRFFTYFECARLAYLERIAPGRTLDAGGVVPLLVHTACDFLLPIEYPATLSVATRAVRVGASSLEMQHLVRDGASGRVHAVGRAVLVFVDLRSRGKVEVPAPLREGVRALDGI